MTTATFSCNSGDCYSDTDALQTGTTIAYLPVDNFGTFITRVWLPFTLTLPNMTITSATLRWVASANGDSTGIAYNIYCSAEDNASDPANKAALEAKSLTTASVVSATLPTAIGTEYSYTVTSLVQEVLSRSGWAYGNNLAIVLATFTRDSTKRCQIALTEHVTYAEPKLDIVYTRYVPRGGALV